MPYVNIRVTPEISDEQCKQLVAEITDSLVRILKKAPDQTHVIIDEVRQERWGFSGQMVSELRKNSTK